MNKLVTTERRRDGNGCWGPFDATACEDATLDDLEPEGMTIFVRIARRARKFPLPEDVPPEGLLKHLNLLNKGRLTNAAVLLFGKSPQRFLISSEIKCAHFHGTEVEKPIPSYQVYKGTVFQLVDQAVDFVLGKIDRRVGTRSESARAPRTYEIPPEVVTEAVVNAVAHRDYTSNGSVQVMLFADRLEVRNPGRLSPSLTLEELRVAHNSVPGSPLLAESLYLVEYIERMGTGTLDMIRRCVEAGLPEPEFAVTDGFVTTVRRAALPGQVGHAGGQAKGQDRGQDRGQAGHAEGQAGHAEGHAGGQARGQAGHAGGQAKGQAGGQAGHAGGQAGHAEGQAGQDGGQAGQDEGQAGQAILSTQDAAMLRACGREAVPGEELQAAAGYSRRTGDFRRRLERLLNRGLLEMTIPDRPRSPLQKYRMTARGKAVLDASMRGGAET